MTNYKARVEAILRDTFASSIVESGQEEEAKAQLTRVAGWALHQDDPNIGYVKKTRGNNVAGLSVDLLMDRSDGSFADIASSKADLEGWVRIRVVWVSHGPSSDLEWVQPTAALAKMPGPMALIEEEPEPVEEPADDEPDELPPADPKTLADVALQLVTEVRGLRSDIQALNGTLLLLAKASG